jgi:molecular chaperone DnaK
VKNYVGIDLGTTNSAICTYDGEGVRIYKSPEQNDVTPSAIFIDRRGNKYLGKRAYDNAAKNPQNAATKFKRMMGTSTPIKLPAVNITMTPEECSAEILRVCFGYLPEEIRNNPDTGTVITVPAAFNQMQKDATMAAAESAGLGKVALMQEPVAAVMSVMRQRKGDGVFLVYDLGGGTLDIAIAESVSGRVSLLAHGGIAMCGGTDFDRIILDNVVKPWLFDNFDLPDDLTVNPKYLPLIRVALWAAEKAKIELSGKEEAIISASESELGVADEAGNEIYIDIPFARAKLDELVSEKVNDSIQATRDTLEKAGLTPNDVERMVFVGGPTHYKPLRDKVSFELGIAASTDVNPMTAVAEGAAVFAESIDWASQSRGRKNSRGTIGSGGKLDISFNYHARTPDVRAKIAAKIGGSIQQGVEFQVDSLDTGWSSGRVKLANGAMVEVTLSKPGENVFKIFVFDAGGGAINIGESKIVITRTAATIDAIPASSSIGIEVVEKGRRELEYLVHDGDPLPVKGKLTFKAAESLRAGANNSIRISLWEGEIKEPVTDNSFIGTLNIKGTDFDDGVIKQGDELIVEFEVLDSGQVELAVSVPSIGGMFRGDRNFYSRQDGQRDFSDASNQIAEEVDSLKNRINTISEKVNDPKLEQALSKLDKAAELPPGTSDHESAKQAMDNVQEAKKLLADVRKANAKAIRQIDLDSCVKFFDDVVRKNARPTESNAFDNLAKSAQRAIDNNGADFENYLDQLRGRNWEILWRQDWFVIEHFKRISDEPWQYSDRAQYVQLSALGKEAIAADDIEKLRKIISSLYSIRISTGEADDMAVANIMRG